MSSLLFSNVFRFWPLHSMTQRASFLKMVKNRKALNRLGLLSLLALFSWILFGSQQENLPVRGNLRPWSLKVFFLKWKTWIKSAFLQVQDAMGTWTWTPEAVIVDRSPKMNQSLLSALLQPLMPNVPFELWEENKQREWFSKSSCGRWHMEFKTKSHVHQNLWGLCCLSDCKIFDQYVSQVHKCVWLKIQLQILAALSNS